MPPSPQTSLSFPLSYLLSSQHRSVPSTSKWNGFVLTAVLGREEVIGLSQLHTCLEHQESYMCLVSPLVLSEESGSVILLRDGDWELKTALGTLSLPGSVVESWVGCHWAALSRSFSWVCISITCPAHKLMDYWPWAQSFAFVWSGKPEIRVF